MAYPDRFAGKVAVVTGGTTGIGRAIARQFVRDGGKIVIGARHDTLFQEIYDELGDNCYCQVCDVAVRADVDALIEAAYEKFGGFDVMFGNAGINLFKDFLEFTEEEHDKIIRNNYKGSFNSTQAAGRAFVAHGTQGVIVNTASINVRCACPNSTPYAASKGAIAAMTQGAAVELAQYGIRCNAISPGHILTDLTQVTWQHPTRSEYLRERIAMGRPGEPDELTGMAILLASDASSYMTGQAYHVDGGCLCGGRPWDYDTQY